MLRAALVALTLLALPASAQAAEGFVGVLEDGRLVRFTTQDTFGLSTPHRPSGLVPGERLVALATARDGLVGVGTSGRLYAVSSRSGRSTPIGPAFPEGLRGFRFSLAVTLDHTHAHLISDVGQSLTIDLLTGETKPGPAVYAPGPTHPAVDFDAHGRLMGFQLGPPTLLRPHLRSDSSLDGTTITSGNPNQKIGEMHLGEPIGFQIGSDGRAYALAVLTERQRSRQSVVLMVNPANGRLIESRSGLMFLPARLTTFASIGQVPEDRSPPRYRLTVPRRVSVHGLLRHRLPFRVVSSEAGSFRVSLYIGPRSIGFGSGGQARPGTMRLASFFVHRNRRELLERSIGKRARIEVRVSDSKGNGRVSNRTIRLVR